MHLLTFWCVPLCSACNLLQNGRVNSQIRARAARATLEQVSGRCLVEPPPHTRKPYVIPEHNTHYAPRVPAPHSRCLVEAPHPSSQSHRISHRLTHTHTRSHKLKQTHTVSHTFNLSTVSVHCQYNFNAVSVQCQYTVNRNRFPEGILRPKMHA